MLYILWEYFIHIGLNLMVFTAITFKLLIIGIKLFIVNIPAYLELARYVIGVSGNLRGFWEFDINGKPEAFSLEINVFWLSVYLTTFVISYTLLYDPDLGLNDPVVMDFMERFRILMNNIKKDGDIIYNVLDAWNDFVYQKPYSNGKLSPFSEQSLMDVGDISNAKNPDLVQAKEIKKIELENKKIENEVFVVKEVLTMMGIGIVICTMLFLTGNLEI